MVLSIFWCRGSRLLGTYLVQFMFLAKIPYASNICQPAAPQQPKAVCSPWYRMEIYLSILQAFGCSLRTLGIYRPTGIRAGERT